MRLPNAAHESGPWRIRKIVPDFRLEDVWALPLNGRPEEFRSALEMVAGFDPADIEFAPARALWQMRDRLGAWFGLDRISTAADGHPRDSLAARLPDDLRGTAADVTFRATPFTPLYRTDDEFAAEVSNRTMHGVMHLAWVDQGGGRYQGQMAVYVKPRGAFGTGYMALIRPFRHRVVYPALMRQFERAWNARGAPQGGLPRRPRPA